MTALQVLDPRACEVWLECARAAVDRDVRAERPWFVAIQRKLQPWKDLLDRRDRARALRARLDAIAAECAALRSLDFLHDVRPPLRREVDTALTDLAHTEQFILKGRAVSDDDLPRLTEHVVVAEHFLMASRFVLLYSALLRLSFEPLVKKAQDAGWGKRTLWQVVLCGEDGLAHRWLAARLYEERNGSGDSTVFVIRNSTGGGWVERIRSFLRQSQQEIVLQLDRFDPGAIDQWASIFFEKAGRPLPAFVCRRDDSREQILFQLARWLGLDEEVLSQRLARAPVRLDEAVAPPTASAPPADRVPVAPSTTPAQPAGRVPVAPSTTPAQPAGRVPVRDVLPAQGRHVLPAQGRHVLAAIGISGYRYWPQLRNPVQDAVRVTDLFQKVGFALQRPLMDGAATSEAIQRLVSDDLAALGSEDSLVLFYAGRAVMMEHLVQNQVVQYGYLIPADAQQEAPSSSWIDLEAWLRAVSVLPARHILVILDVYGTELSLKSALKWGNIDFGPRSMTSSMLTSLRGRTSRHVITSGLEPQEMLESRPVPGCSLFAGCLIEALEDGLASRHGGAPYVTGSELGLDLQRRVRRYSDGRQVPSLWAFRHHEGGELFIPLFRK